MPVLTIDDLAPHVRRITLNRPERLNALDYPLAGALHDALDEVGTDPECRVVVLTGAGRGFCAGLDLQDFGRPPTVGEHRRAHAGTDGQSFLSDLPVHIRSTPQIVLAAVNGAAFGGGLSLALAADLRVAGRSARFCSAFIKTGLTGTDLGVTYLLPRLIGASRAFDLIVSGRTVEADEAHQLGLVSRVVDDDALRGRDARAVDPRRLVHEGRAPHDEGSDVGEPRHAEPGRRDRAREPQPDDRGPDGRGPRVHGRLLAAAPQAVTGLDRRFGPGSARR